MSAADQEIAFERDDILLWKAAVSNKFYHNRAIVLPETRSQHVDLVNRYANSTAGLRRTLLVNTIMAQDVVLDRYLAHGNEDQRLLDKLPDAWNRTKVNIVLKSLVGREPSLKELLQGDVPGGLVGTIDAMRDNKIALNMAKIYLNLLNTSVAEQVEAHYRQAVGNRTLPEDVRLYFDETEDEVGVHSPEPTGPKFPLMGTMVRVSYAGDVRLNDVLVVTRAKMRPPSPQGQVTRGMIRLFNEILDEGSERNKQADTYLQTSQLLDSTPQATVAYIPKLEPGDVLYIPLYSFGSYWDILEAKVSFYSDRGAVLDKVMMKGGPENDLSVPSAQRKARKKPVPKQPVGPKFQRNLLTSRVELELFPPPDGVKQFSFESCVPVDESFLAIGTKVDVEAGKNLMAVAKSSNAYVAVGSPRLTGHGLILVPKAAVAKTTVIDERTDEQKALDREHAEQIKRNNNRTRGIPDRRSFFPPFPTPSAPKSGRATGKSVRPSRSNATTNDAVPVTAEPTGPPYQPLDRSTTLLLTPQLNGSKLYRFATCTTSGSSYKPTGKTIEIEFDARLPLRGVAVGAVDYVAVARNAATRGTAMVLIPKSVLSEIKKTK